jgi:hypothetical protein
MIDTNKMTYVGSFAVDSGQAIVGDPCYLDAWEAKYDNFEEHVNKAGEYGYLGACQATLSSGFGVLGMGKAVAFTTGYGDGYYPVYAQFDNDGRIAKIVIDFVDEEIED